MILPEQMQKIVIVGTSYIKSDLISFLQDQGVIEITEFVEDELAKYVDKTFINEKKPIQGFEEVSEQLVKIRAILGYLKKMGITPSKQFFIDEQDLKSTIKRAKQFTSLDITQMLNEREDILSNIKELEKKEHDLQYLKFFGELDLKDLSLGEVNYFFGLIDSNELGKLKEELENELGNNFDLIHYSFDNKEIILLLFPKNKTISPILFQFDVKEIELPKGFRDYSSEIKKIQELKKLWNKELKKIDRKLEQLSKNVDKLKKIEQELLVLSDRYVVAMKFLSGKKIFALSGWIEAKNYDKLKNKLEKKFDGQVKIFKVHGKNPPTVLINPKPLEGFQFLVEFFALPKNNEIDPTFILAFFIPLMIGMIIGDVGYGLLSAIISYFLIKNFKNKLLVNTAKIWLISSISSIFFGVIFDEWFGFTHFELINILNSYGLDFSLSQPLYHGLHRLDDLSLLLLITILLGMFQLSLGYLLGFVNKWRYDKKEAIAKLAWFFLILSGFTSVLSYFGYLPLFSFSLVVFLICILIIAFCEGLVGIFEIPSMFGSIISYIRIAMAGVTGVILAKIINSVLLPNPREQGFLAFLILPVFLLLHIINAFLAMFEGIVQGGRLNLVEFYSRFFEGGGKEFKPFQNPYKKHKKVKK